MHLKLNEFCVFTLLSMGYHQINLYSNIFSNFFKVLHSKDFYLLKNNNNDTYINISRKQVLDNMGHFSRSFFPKLPNGLF